MWSYQFQRCRNISIICHKNFLFRTSHIWLRDSEPCVNSPSTCDSSLLWAESVALSSVNPHQTLCDGSSARPPGAERSPKPPRLTLQCPIVAHGLRLRLNTNPISPSERQIEKARIQFLHYPPRISPASTTVVAFGPFVGTIEFETQYFVFWYNGLYYHIIWWLDGRHLSRITRVHWPRCTNSVCGNCTNHGNDGHRCFCLCVSCRPSVIRQLQFINIYISNQHHLYKFKC